MRVAKATERNLSADAAAIIARVEGDVGRTVPVHLTAATQGSVRRVLEKVAESAYQRGLSDAHRDPGTPRAGPLSRFGNGTP